MRQKDIFKAENADKTKQKETAKNARPKSILESFEYIVELAENTNLDKDFFDKAAVHIRFASRRLKLTPMQTVLLAMFVDRSEDRSIMLSEIASYAGCRTTKILRLSNEIDVLEHMHYLRASRGRRSLSYRVPTPVLDALRKNQPYVHVEEPVPDTISFFDCFDRLMDEKNDDELTYEALKERTMELLEEIKATTFATGLRRHRMDNDDTLLFVYMAHLFVENNDDNIGFHDFERLYDNDDVPGWCKRAFRSRESNLFEYKLIITVR